MKKIILFCVLLNACAPKLDVAASLSEADTSYQSSTEATSSQNQETETQNGEDQSGLDNSASLISPTLLQINEVLYDSVADEQDGNTFIELYGTPNSSLSGYSIEIIDGTSKKMINKILFSDKNNINSAGFFVVCDAKTGSKLESNISSCDLVDHFDTQNGPDVVRVLNPIGETIDNLCYGFELASLDAALCPYQSVEDASAGRSLSRINYLNSFNNFSDFALVEAPSPGQSGSENPQEGDLNISQNETNLSQNLSIHFEKIRIEEVITDPQRDWNDSFGGNGIPFDVFFGNGTIGSTDEWVELKNVSSERLSLQSWALNFTDGSDEQYVFDSSKPSFLTSDSENNLELDPQELLVITDVPGDMKNKIALTLLDAEEKVVDEVFIEDGNANSFADEANLFDLEKNISKNEATILF